MGGPWCLWITKSWLGRDSRANAALKSTWIRNKTNDDVSVYACQAAKHISSLLKVVQDCGALRTIITQGKFYKNSF